MKEQVKVQLYIHPKTRRALRIHAAVNDITMGQALDEILGEHIRESKQLVDYHDTRLGQEEVRVDG